MIKTTITVCSCGVELTSTNGSTHFKTIKGFNEHKSANQFKYDLAEQQRKHNEFSAKKNSPVVGGPATMHIGSDRTPYVVVAISKTGAVVTLAPVTLPKDRAASMERIDTMTMHGVVPSWRWEANENDLKWAMEDEFHERRFLTKANRQKDGSYKSKGTPVTFASAVYFYDASF